MSRGYGRMRRWLVGVGVAASLLVFAGCADAGPSGAQSTPSATATATLALPTATTGPSITVIASTGAPASGPTLAWHKAALPSGFGLEFRFSDVEPAPSNGSTAYACAPLPAQPLAQAYAITSANAGASFGSKVRVGSGWGSCAQVVVDELIPSHAIAYQDFGTSGALTTNGGATWQPFSTTYLRQMATVGTTTYAIQGNDNSQPDSLIASSDGMRTWHQLAMPIDTGGAPSASLWAQSSGSLLIETGGDNAPTNLNVSSNGGATWQPVLTPSDAFYPNFVYAQASGSGAWTICGMYTNEASNGALTIACTRDSGASWDILPQLDASGPASLSLAGVTADGAVLAMDDGSGGASLYRWSPGATRWQSLGALPLSAADARFYPSPSGGAVWAFVAESDGATPGGQPNDIYSAPYPAA